MQAEANPPQAAEAFNCSSSALTVATLAIWFAGVLVLAAAGAFAASPTQPPLGIFLAIILPPLLFALLYRLSHRFRDFALAIDLRWLTAIQGWRVIGVMFLALYAFGLLPGLFAWPAGLGDAAVGLAAPFVLLAILRGAPNWQRRVFWLNIAGLIDFAAAITTGVLTSTSALGLLADGAPRVPRRTAAEPRADLRGAAVDHLSYDLAAAAAARAKQQHLGRMIEAPQHDA